MNFFHLFSSYCKYLFSALQYSLSTLSELIKFGILRIRARGPPVTRVRLSWAGLCTFPTLISRASAHSQPQHILSTFSALTKFGESIGVLRISICHNLKISGRNSLKFNKYILKLHQQLLSNIGRVGKTNY